MKERTVEQLLDHIKEKDMNLFKQVMQWRGADPINCEGSLWLALHQKQPLRFIKQAMPENV